MKKRGAISIQFNWILVLIAGGMIFLFFFSVVKWAQNSSSQSNANTVSTYLDSILTGASVTKETVNKMELPFDKIEFSCDDFKVDKSSNLKNIKNKIIFAPSRLENEGLITWTLSWNVPFRVTNFLFLSSPSIRYIFIGEPDDELFKYVKEKIPKELNAEFNPSEIKNKNHFKIKIIYITSEVTYNPLVLNLPSTYLHDFRKMDAEDVEFLLIRGTKEHGELEFFQKSPIGVSPTMDTSSQKNSNYFESGLFGAVFSNFEDYECNIKKAFKRLNGIAKIYHKRAEILKLEYDGTNDLCYLAYSDYVDWGLNSDLDENSIRDMMDDLIEVNRKAQSYSCAMVY